MERKEGQLEGRLSLGNHRSNDDGRFGTGLSTGTCHEGRMRNELLLRMMMQRYRNEELGDMPGVPRWRANEPAGFDRSDVNWEGIGGVYRRDQGLDIGVMWKLSKGSGRSGRSRGDPLLPPLLPRQTTPPPHLPGLH